MANGTEERDATKQRHVRLLDSTQRNATEDRKYFLLLLIGNYVIRQKFFRLLHSTTTRL